MFRPVCAIEPSFFKTTSGMHRRLFEGLHLVFFFFIWFVSPELSGVSIECVSEGVLLGGGVRLLMLRTRTKLHLLTVAAEIPHWELLLLLLSLLLVTLLHLPSALLFMPIYVYNVCFF